MSDDTFRQRRPDEIPSNDNFVPQNMTPTGGLQIQGNIPAAFQQALNAGKNPSEETKQGFGQMGVSNNPSTSNRQVSSISGSEHLQKLLTNLKLNNTTFEEVQLPSKGRFYSGSSLPGNGIVKIRPMTGEEEQILATPRFVRKGQAINMIFQKCLADNVKAEDLLSIDRTYLLIYLRGISYSPSYDVEIKCPECEKKFNTTIDLNNMFVEMCPDDHGPTLQDVTPTTKLPFSYRYPTGKDEQEVSDYKERRIKMFGDHAADDTLTYKTAMLLEQIDGINSKTELQVLLKNLPVNDVSYIRNCINEPPFGVDTSIEIICPACLHEFSIELPLEASFFFPRRKKEKTQA